MNDCHLRFTLQKHKTALSYETPGCTVSKIKCRTLIKNTEEMGCLVESKTYTKNALGFLNW